MCLGLCACSVMSNSVTPWTAVHQAPLCMEFFRQEYWSGLPFPTQGIFPTERSKLCLLCLLHWQVDSLPQSQLHPYKIHHTNFPHLCVSSKSLHEHKDLKQTNSHDKYYIRDPKMFQTEIFQQYFGREERRVEKSNGCDLRDINHVL